MDSNIALSNSLHTKVKMTVLRKGRDISFAKYLGSKQRGPVPKMPRNVKHSGALLNA
jgi:hypothetical protein